MAHTLGTWRISSEPDGLWIDAGRIPVCRIRASGPPTSNEIADASLIAAAPDMLALLRDIIERTTEELKGPRFSITREGQELFDRAVALVAKATGESL